MTVQRHAAPRARLRPVGMVREGRSSAKTDVAGAQQVCIEAWSTGRRRARSAVPKRSRQLCRTAGGDDPQQSRCTRLVAVVVDRAPHFRAARERTIHDVRLATSSSFPAPAASRPLPSRPERRDPWRCVGGSRPPVPMRGRTAAPPPRAPIEVTPPPNETMPSAPGLHRRPPSARQRFASTDASSRQRERDEIDRRDAQPRPRPRTPDASPSPDTPPPRTHSARRFPTVELVPRIAKSRTTSSIGIGSDRRPGTRRARGSSRSSPAFRLGARRRGDCAIPTRTDNFLMPTSLRERVTASVTAASSAISPSASPTGRCDLRTVRSRRRTRCDLRDRHRIRADVEPIRRRAMRRLLQASRYRSRSNVRMRKCFPTRIAGRSRHE
jgi:hypothetical protein